MQDICDAIPDEAIFEQVKDNIENGVIVIDDLGEIGFVYVHDDHAFRAYAVVGDVRYELGEVDLFSVVDVSAAVNQRPGGRLGVRRLTSRAPRVRPGLARNKKETGRVAGRDPFPYQAPVVRWLGDTARKRPSSSENACGAQNHTPSPRFFEF